MQVLRAADLHQRAIRGLDSGIGGQEQERAQQDEVHGALQPGGAAGDGGQDGGHHCDGEQHDLGGIQAEDQGPVEPDRGRWRGW